MLVISEELYGEANAAYNRAQNADMQASDDPCWIIAEAMLNAQETSLRDQIAIASITGTVLHWASCTEADEKTLDEAWVADETRMIAQAAYRMADAMLKARRWSKPSKK